MKITFNNGQHLDLSTPKVMGILNLTPDSFYDGGKYKDVFFHQAEKMINEGADIIDIGGISTRPGAEEVTSSEETERVVEAIYKISSKFPEIPVSIDTYRSEVAETALEAGAKIINDISGGTFDAEMFDLVAKLKVPYVLMHIKGTPKNMQQNPQYDDVVQEVVAFFENQCNQLLAKNPNAQIILDPGFGFGKNLQHNYQLLAGLPMIQQLGFPVLSGVSRKSMINKVIGTIPENALNGTTVINTIALLNGSNILRVHDVKEAKQAILLTQTYMNEIY